MKNSLKVGSAFIASVLLMGCAKSVDDSPFVKRQVLLGEPSTAIGSTTINIFDAGYKYGHQEIVVNFDLFAADDMHGALPCLQRRALRAGNAVCV